MADTILALTALGQALKAKIETGGGTIPLEITRIVSASGTDPDPVNLTNLINPKLEFAVTGVTTTGARTTINAMLTNAGDSSQGIPPLAAGYPLSQIGFYARDPDRGEILYRITQYDNPMYVPAANERGFTYTPSFNIITANASEVIIEINPAGLLTVDQLDAAIYNHDNGNASHYDLRILIEQIAEALSNEYTTAQQTGSAINDAIQAHNIDPAAHGNLQQQIYELLGRVTNLELVVGGAISTNAFSITFATLAGLTVTGVWNQAQGRIEF